MGGQLTSAARVAQPAGCPAPGRIDGMVHAAVEAIAYSDVFDWPLTAAEAHRFLPIPAPADDVAMALSEAQAAGTVSSAGGVYFMPGREPLVDRRARREASSARLWLARALTIALGKAAARTEGRREVWLCPNYFVSMTALELPERDVFTAHELTQLVPLFGPDTYRALLAANRWYRDFLPNHPGHQGPIAELRGRRMRGAVEPILRNRVVSRLERWEMDRKIARLGAGPASAEVRFDATMCKGHFGGHRRRTLESLDAGTTWLEARAP